jgi:hypothetical protein
MPSGTSPWAGWIGFCKLCQQWQWGAKARPVAQTWKGGAPSWVCARCGEEWGVGVWPWACPAHAAEVAKHVSRFTPIVEWDGPPPCEQRDRTDCVSLPTWWGRK